MQCPTGLGGMAFTVALKKFNYMCESFAQNKNWVLRCQYLLEYYCSRLNCYGLIFTLTTDFGHMRLCKPSLRTFSNYPW